MAESPTSAASAGQPNSRVLGIAFAASVFLSAFLLFQVQPMIAKFLLPWFGGTPSVWSTALLFFQALLLGGYAYAYWLIGRARAQTQALIHVALVAVTVLVMLGLGQIWSSPITPSASFRPTDGNAPVLAILALLTISVGLPYFALSSNGPLMQAWFSRTLPGRSYAPLYALSNTGSLLGLLTYPVLLEPTLALHRQGWLWTAGVVAYAALAGGLAIRSRMASVAPSSLEARSGEAPPGEAPLGAAPTVASISRAQRLLWIVLSGTASLFLLSTTNQITQEVAAIPFLWVLPLGLYLVSFILCFAGSRWYGSIFAALFVLLAALVVLAISELLTLHAGFQILAYNGLLFAACMLCHGELYRLRPAAEHLTDFYLMIAFGGVFGGVFVNLIAPFIFNGYWEFFIAIACTIALLLTLTTPKRAANLQARARFMVNIFLLATVGLAVVSAALGSVYTVRNYYGVVRVHDVAADIAQWHARVMVHGVTVHGLQYVEPDRRREPTTYYVRDSGVGLTILNHSRYGSGMRVGVLGLGVGTVATYGQPGDLYRFYEINPAVIELAEGGHGFFSFLPDSRATVEVVPGDARISLERELAAGNPQRYDVLVLDTFSSDSIPVHLLTREAIDLYLQHLAPDGALAAHISNRHLDLEPVFWQLAQLNGLTMKRIDRDGADGYASIWILLARDPRALDSPAIRQRETSLEGYSTTLPVWTDEYSNLFQILR